MVHNILVLGGSGKSGRPFVENALERGYHVTALTSNAGALEAYTSNTLLHIVEGTPLEKADLEKCFASAPKGLPITAVACLLGHRFQGNMLWGKPVGEKQVLTKSITNLIPVMNAQSPPLKRLVFEESFAGGSGRESVNFTMRLARDYLAINYAFLDHDAVEKIFKEGAAKDLDWTMVRATALTDKPAGPIEMIGEEPKGLVFPSCSRASVAIFMLDIIESGEYKRQTPVIMDK